MACKIFFKGVSFGKHLTDMKYAVRRLWNWIDSDEERRITAACILAVVLLLAILSLLDRL